MNKKLIIFSTFTFACVLFALSWKAEATYKRQQEVRVKGAEVMPFDLTKTTHIFHRTEEGGIQQVRAKDPTDQEQIDLIRIHLKEEALMFRSGDFSDPKELHGESMPGVSTLEEKSEYSVEYQDLQDGGQITYITDDEEILRAFHNWFSAQLHDHGEDAVDSL